MIHGTALVSRQLCHYQKDKNTDFHMLNIFQELWKKIDTYWLVINTVMQRQKNLAYGEDIYCLYSTLVSLRPKRSDIQKCVCFFG